VNRNAIDPETKKWVQQANLDGFSDKSIETIKFETPDGKPIAVYMNYAMHPVNAYVLGVYSGDVPGAVCRYVEKAFNDEIVVTYSQGAQGDQFPLYLRASTNAMASRSGVEITGYMLNREEVEGPLRMVGTPGAIEAEQVDPKILDDLFRFIESEGQILGEEVIRVMQVTKRMSGNVDIKGQRRVLAFPGRKRIDATGAHDPSTREGSPGEYVDGPDVNVIAGVLGIGTSAICWANTDPFSIIGQRIKDESPLTNTMFCAVAKTEKPYAGYMPNDAAYGQYTFQVLNSPFKQGYAEDILVNEMVEMITEYLDK
jgi:hypothetical protein